MLIFLCAFTATFMAEPGICAAQAPDLDLRVYCHEQGYGYFWDPLAKNAIIQTRNGEFRLHAGSDYILRDGRLERIAEKAKLSDGAMFAGSSIAALLEGSSLRTPARGSEAVPLEPPLLFHVQKVVVDAGHGGKDSGAASSRGLKEKGLVLEVARKVKERLEARGIQVVMTRNADVFIPLSERAQIANKNGADFFISIHANASTSRSLNGFEVYYLSEATDDAALAVERAENSVIRYEPDSSRGLTKNLKTILWDLRESQNRKESLKAASAVTDSVNSSVSIAAKRVRSANFYVLKWAECPAILVELGYITNGQDERRLRDPAYKSVLADALVDGFWAYKKELEKTEGFTK
jgi:N-acetylmuramoyl-L-alanine amidase